MAPLPFRHVRILGDAGLFGSGEDNLAQVGNDGELVITSTERERNVFAQVQKTGITANEHFILVDLDDTDTFPHDETGRIDLTFLQFEIERGSASDTGRLEVGVVTRVDETDADITFFEASRFERADDLKIRKAVNYAPSQVKLGVSSGSLDSFLSNVQVSNETAVNTGASLDSPAGDTSVTPAVGDVVLKVVVDSGTIDFRTLCGYHAEPA